MTTVVVPRAEAKRRRSYDMFADLTDVAVANISRGYDGSVTVEFAGDLAPEVEALVWDRLTSSSDADSAQRAALADAAAQAAAYVPPTLPASPTTEDLAAANADLTAQVASQAALLAAALDYVLNPTTLDAP